MHYGCSIAVIRSCKMNKSENMEKKTIGITGTQRLYIMIFIYEYLHCPVSTQ